MRKGLALVVTLAGGCGRIAFDGVPDDAPARARSMLVLDRVVPDGPLTDFPLPIILDATRADPALLSAATFRAVLDGVELPVEVETAPGELPFVAWVRVPRIDVAPVEIAIAYGGEPIAHVSPWDTSYLGVWHMNRGAADSSPFARAHTQANVVDTAGRVGGAARFDLAQQSCVRVPSFSGLDFGATTLMGWMRHRTAMTGISQVIVTRQRADMPTDDIMLSTEFTNRAFGHVAVSSGGNPTRLGTSVLTAQVWHHLAYSFDGVSSTLYVDGVLEAGGPGDGTPFTSARPLFIGCGRNLSGTPIDEADNDYVDGDLDEVRIEAVGRSAAWIEYTVRAQRDEVISYGHVER